MCAQQRFFRLHARDERRDKQGCLQQAYTGTKGENPAEHIEDQSEIAGVANETVNVVGHQRMSRLNRDEPAEAAAEHKDRPLFHGQF